MSVRKKAAIVAAMLLACSACQSPQETAAAQENTSIDVKSGTLNRPNIIIFYADDLGLGDVQTYDATSTIPTPHINRLAERGIKLTDAHSPSAVCTPSRYSLLTGRYAFRTWLDDAVLRSSYDGALLEPEHETIAGLAKRAGYVTSAFGKWHVGNEWWNAAEDGVAKPGVGTSQFSTQDVSFDKPIIDGPSHHGFDYFFGLGSTVNHGPYTFIENDRVVKIPNEFREETPFPGGVFREDWIADGWDDSETISTVGEKALDYLKDHLSQDAETPFFMFFSSPANHWPFVPPESFQGQAVRGTGGADDDAPERNDTIVANDLILGALVDLLEDPDQDGDNSDSISEQTLILFSSDNGADYGQFAGLRGKKRTIWEGGHRVPFIASWPGVIEQGQVSDTLFSQIDLYASLAALLDVEPAVNAAQDSFDGRAALGLSTNPDHAVDRALFQLDGGAEVYAVRFGAMKLIVEDGVPTALFDLSADLSESLNLITNEARQIEVQTMMRWFETVRQP